MSISLESCKKIMNSGKKFDLGLFRHMNRTAKSLQKKLDEWQKVIGYAEQNLKLEAKDEQKEA